MSICNTNCMVLNLDYDLCLNNDCPAVCPLHFNSFRYCFIMNVRVAAVGENDNVNDKL